MGETLAFACRKDTLVGSLEATAQESSSSTQAGLENKALALLTNQALADTASAAISSGGPRVLAPRSSRERSPRREVSLTKKQSTQSSLVQQYPAGLRGTLSGLKVRPELNGRVVEVLRVDPTTERLVVTFAEHRDEER